MNSTNASVPDPEGEYQVIRLGGHEAAFVSLADLRRLQAVDQHDPAEVVEEVEVASTIATYRAWAAAGRPGAISHKQAMAELLTVPDAADPRPSTGSAGAALAAFSPDRRLRG